MKNVVDVMRKSIVVNTTLAIIKVFIGLLAKSGALIADGIHSFSDLVTDFVAIFGTYLSKKPADEKHPFGHGKIEYLTSIGISLVIIFMGLFIIYESRNNESLPSILVLSVSVFTIISKYVLSSYIIKKGYKYKNNILISSGYESRTDVISSIVVLISSVLMLLSEKIEILKYADVVAMIIVGLFIIRTGYKLLVENISTILGEKETDEEEINKVKNIINKVEDIKTIDSLLLIKYGTYYKLICEVGMDENAPLKDVHSHIELLEKKLKSRDKRIKYVTIHVNPIKE
ncbi:MAG TPA: cation diffusion facilitator family transporter [Bacilli bacterium]|nr:cation diffusion facilitator family transporter [Bacilli bacterium]